MEMVEMTLLLGCRKKMSTLKSELENFDNNINSSFIAVDTGVVQVIYGSSNGLSATAVLPDQVLRQGFANIEELSEGGDFFGYSG